MGYSLPHHTDLQYTNMKNDSEVDEERGSSVLSAMLAFLCLSTVFALVAVSDTHMPIAQAGIVNEYAPPDSVQVAAMEPVLMQPYNETLAVYLAYVTSVSYCEQQHIQAWNCSPCAVIPPLHDPIVVDDPKDSFQGLVGYSSAIDAVIVAFRGSMDISNWLDNFTFYKTRPFTQFPDVLVHMGFYWVYQSVQKEISNAVTKLMEKHKGAKLMVTGHSLGAAVASICAFHLQLIENRTVHTSYTFGEPRVGNQEFSQQYNKAIPNRYRLTHARDVVPHLPPAWTGFYHTTREIFYNEFSDQYQECNDDAGEDINCSNACSPFGCNSIVDHLTYLNVTMSHLVC